MQQKGFMGKFITSLKGDKEIPALNNGEVIVRH